MAAHPTATRPVRQAAGADPRASRNARTTNPQSSGKKSKIPLDKYIWTIYYVSSMAKRAIIPPLELAVLGLLWRQPRSGYDLLKVFSETALGGFSSSAGAVYPALKRLGRHGHVTAAVENRNTLRPRQVYSITPRGAEALRQQLCQPVTRDDIMRRPEVVLLRFVFTGEVVGRDEAISILEQYAGQVEAYLPDLRAQLAALPRTGGGYGRYALQRGIDGYETDARWARKVIRELTRRGAKHPRNTLRKGGNAP